ncbi:Hpt domain-containing protein [Desulfovibrio gilichinskyi]|uniref:HPt (Histidine-containing phosphotransfer) domain-containing protein n=1 Tax=Desulfovibrio gilichinskyi TaxID=1519643 RepID=A0A1X7EMN6_9BACT|nr:Hpt domain-containing protein [Desulfovibrio gilichinskyi]SMF36633.1 HPt (histidine-containing phosphotransfer) domain-containing protein [Desulfovibrio gilichinskyi]
MNSRFIIKVDEDLEQIMPRYLEIRHKELVELEEAIKTENFDQIRMLGHKLKGTGAAYGFEELTRLGQLIEDKACAKIMEEVPESTAQIRKYLENVEIEYVPMD